ncbi:MAG: nickel-dependent lactate racemase [Deltaproteobacteria bacterium]|nr:nickel-dependent lactate racemase [Deltaproteobacteria bacterium]MBW2219182.1 nickel-dependent lactate racemase [Deltaproteobacteria bacterium]
MMTNTVKLAYGNGFLEMKIDESRFDITTVIPKNPPALDNPRDIFLEKASSPMEAQPLFELVARKAKSSPDVVIVIADHTRPVPDHLLIPWIVDCLGVPDNHVTILVGTGTHRPSTKTELQRMLGRENLDRFKVLCHDCRDNSMLMHMGKSACGGTCILNRVYCEADIKIATGFIEPHFFAGFSGGAKAIVPGIAGLETISYFHRSELIAHPNTTWGETADNPLQKLTREMVSLCPPDFIVNVSLNHQKEIAGIFVGDYIEAHEEGCLNVSRESCTKVPQKFPLVITSNSGYPLDMNFYQTIKGISAASRIVEKGGSIIIASECRQGIPEGSHFEQIMSRGISSRKLLQEIMARKTAAYDDWQVQVLLEIIQDCDVFLYSSMGPDLQEKARVTFIEDIENKMEALRMAFGFETMSMAALPLGPLTIPLPHHPD